MDPISLIEKKRDGGEWSSAEVDTFVYGYLRGDIPDYQAAAWLMALCIRGMTPAETLALTLAMAHSGDTLDLSGLEGPFVDKHSSGGVGDKTTLVVLPLVAACGAKVAKMSGRGLGTFGGTVDKLESIRGLRVSLSGAEFLAQVAEHGIALSGQSKDLAPADGRFYALRDVTGTVPSVPLMASSIMSKKIAAGARGIVLDVKYGSGSFMPDRESARELAACMAEIGRGAGRRVTALLSDTNQPLGRAVGNALEVREAIETLRGEGPRDLRDHCLLVAQEMLRLAFDADDAALAGIRQRLEEALDGGLGLEKLRTLVDVQGGDVRQVDDPDTLPQASSREHTVAARTGYLTGIDALAVGRVCLELGAGRMRKEDRIDPAVGLLLHRQVGDRVDRGDRLCTVHASTDDAATEAAARLEAAFAWGDSSKRPDPPEVLRG